MTINELYHILSEARARVMQYPNDDFAPTVLGITVGLIHPDSEFGQAADGGALKEWYRDLAEQLAEESAASKTPLSDVCLALCAKVEISEERGIINDMPPTQGYPQPVKKQDVKPPEVVDELREWRIECFVELDFTDREAAKLADAKTIDWVKDPKTGIEKPYESPLHHSKAKRLLSQGVNHRQIVNLLT